LLLFAAKKLKLRQLLANPLKDQEDIVKNDKFWKFAAYNALLMGTLGFTVTSFFRSEANKLLLFKKYEKQISNYMKWRTDREIVAYLKRVPVD
jgi:hypothetical protein